jgi:glycosyltransferase involved in cell wall biosynthesis
MRILIANDGVSDAGGVQAYLTAIVPALASRGHAVAFAYCTDSGSRDARPSPRGLAMFRFGAGKNDALEAIRRWAPDICYSHNMRDLAVERSLGAVAPVVKFMHGYFGTCISGLKMHAFPHAACCDRVFGPACAALYVPRRCGRLNPVALVSGWRWASAQQSLFETYSAIVVASAHMQREYVRHGCGQARVHVNPLFPTNDVDPSISQVPTEPHIAFLGRMTMLKGGDLLIGAVRHAAERLGRAVQLTMMGDGPQRQEWEALASRLNVAATFTGWVNGGDRWKMLRRASAVALPSLWPEPFGLVGLEAGALGVPAIAVDAGGVKQWLHPGINGVLVPSPATDRTFGDALAELLADRGALATLRAGAHRVASEMTLATHVDRLESIFQAVNGARSAIA